MRASLPRPPRRLAPRDRHHVAELGATLGDEQIVVAADLVEVRRLWVSATSPAPDAPQLAHALPGGDINFALLDAPERDGRVDLGRRREARHPVAGQIHAGIVVEEE